VPRRSGRRSASRRRGHEKPPPSCGEDHEKDNGRRAIRTDFILSAEIMVIALNEVATEPFLSRLIILIVVALASPSGSTASSRSSSRWTTSVCT
jgi:predicted DNA repair protein MutK